MTRSSVTWKRRLFSTLILVILITTIVPLSAGAAANTGVATRWTLRINAGSQPELLDPQKASYVSEVGHLGLIYESLVRLDKDLNPVPGAAQSWSFSQDLRTVTFTLRSGLKYSDGSLLNARRFEYSILRTIDPITAGEYSAIYDNIEGAAAWRGADTAVLTSEELAQLKANVEVKSLTTNGLPCTSYTQANCLILQIKLNKPEIAFPYMMSLWMAYPAKEELVTAGGDNWWADPNKLVGNGPFILTSTDQTAANFSPNPYYWRGVPTYSIRYHYINDLAVALEEYQQGKLDITPVYAEQAASIKADPILNKDLRVYAGSCTYAVMFNNNKPPFTDRKVREAFSHAFNRQAFVDEVLGGAGNPTLTWIPPGMPGYDAGEDRWGYDPAKAVQAFNASGYTLANLPPITLTFSDSPRNRTRWEWLAAQWKQVLNVNTVLNPVEPSVYVNLTKDPATAPQIYLLGWCADYPDPSNWLSVYWRTGAFSERIGYSNLQLDTLLDQADMEPNPTTRAALYAQAQDMLIGDIPVAMAWNNVNTYLVKPHVLGAVNTPTDSLWPGSIDPLAVTINTYDIFLPATRR